MSNQTTHLAGIDYRNGHPVIEYMARLDMCLALTAAVPPSVGTRQTRKQIQNLLSSLKVAMSVRQPQSALDRAELIQSLMESFSAAAASTLKEPECMPAWREENQQLYALHTAVRLAAIAAVNARDYLELHESKTSSVRVATLDSATAALDCAYTWVRRFIQLISCDDSGKLPADKAWVPWGDEDLAELIT